MGQEAEEEGGEGYFNFPHERNFISFIDFTSPYWNHVVILSIPTNLLLEIVNIISSWNFLFKLKRNIFSFTKDFLAIYNWEFLLFAPHLFTYYILAPLKEPRLTSF